MKTLATQEELNLRDPRKRERNHQLEFPFPGKRGRKAQKLLDRKLGIDLKGFVGRIAKLDAGTKCQIIAHDAGEARAMLWRQVRDVWPNVTFMDIRITRNHEVDPHAQKLGKGIWTDADLTIAISKLGKRKK